MHDRLVGRWQHNWNMPAGRSACHYCNDITAYLSVSLSTVITDVWRIGQIRCKLTRVRVIAHAMVMGT